MPTRQLGKFKVFYQGTWNEKIFTKCMGVVGSRHMTDYGRRVIDKIVPQLVLEGWTIISGFMYGVDLTAHQVCLDSGGTTIAVLGWGINYPVDADQTKMYQRIIATGGLVISLWDHQAGTNWTFPARNRLVAHLCHELLVVEAAAKSGALLTAAMVRNLGKKVWAVPGSIISPTSAGTNRLIAEGKALPWLGNNFQPQLINSPPAHPILKLLSGQTLDAGAIARALNQPMDQIASQLSLLTLQGAVTETNTGKYYAG
jgi:DNA processing protein